MAPQSHFETEIATNFVSEMFKNVHSSIDHVTAMRGAMERMEIYMLAMTAAIYVGILVSIIGGALYFLTNRRKARKRVAASTKCSRHPYTPPVHKAADAEEDCLCCPPSSRKVASLTNAGHVLTYNVKPSQV